MPDLPDRLQGKEPGRDWSPGNSPSSGDDKKDPDKGGGKIPEKVDQPPANSGDNSSIPSPAVTETKRVTSSFVSNRLGKYDGTTCLGTFFSPVW